MPERPRGVMKRWYETNCGLCGVTEWFLGMWDAMHRGMANTHEWGWVHKSCLAEKRKELREARKSSKP